MPDEFEIQIEAMTTDQLRVEVAKEHHSKYQGIKFDKLKATLAVREAREQQQQVTALGDAIVKSGLGITLGLTDLRSNLDALNKHVADFNDGSTKLSTALHRLTIWGTVIAAIGLLIAAASLCVEIYKVRHGIS